MTLKSTRFEESFVYILYGKEKRDSESWRADIPLEWQVR